MILGVWKGVHYFAHGGPGWELNLGSLALESIFLITTVYWPELGETIDQFFACIL